MSKSIDLQRTPSLPEYVIRDVLCALVERLRDPYNFLWHVAWNDCRFVNGAPTYEAHVQVFQKLRGLVYGASLSEVLASLDVITKRLDTMETEGVMVKGTAAPQPTWESQELELIPTGMLDETVTLFDRPVSMVVRTEQQMADDRAYVEYLETKAAEESQQ